MRFKGLKVQGLEKLILCITQGVDGQVVGKVRRDDPASWSEAHGWDLDEEGMIGLPPVWSSRAMHNRQADKVSHS